MLDTETSMIAAAAAEVESLRAVAIGVMATSARALLREID